MNHAFWFSLASASPLNPLVLGKLLRKFLGCKKNLNSNLIYEGEKHFKNVKQITFGGDNAEAYWSFDDKNLVFQSNYNEWRVECDQMFLMSVDESFELNTPKMLSTGDGRTTCSYFMPDNKHILYASTHEDNKLCPETPLRVNGNYVWPCLLYTSPSPRDQRGSRMPSSA